MKKICLTITIIVSLLAGIAGLQAQTANNKLDQIALAKKFHGKWICDSSKDSSEIWIIKSLGKGYEMHYKYTAAGKIYIEGKQLWGFDSKYEYFVVCTMDQEGLLYRATGKFTSDKKMYWESQGISDPERVTRLDFEFISADSFTITERQKVKVFHKIKNK
jgi:hypothetical protein